MIHCTVLQGILYYILTPQVPKASLKISTSNKLNLIWACSVTQPCSIFSDPMDCSLPGSSVHGTFQLRILEWVAISCFRGSSQPQEGTQVSCASCIGRWILFFFFFLSFENFYFIYKELVLFPPKVDVLDEPSKEVQLVQLNEADVLRILAETWAAHTEAVFPDQTMPV